MTSEARNCNKRLVRHRHEGPLAPWRKCPSDELRVIDFGQGPETVRLLEWRVFHTGPNIGSGSAKSYRVRNTDTGREDLVGEEYLTMPNGPRL